jgi:hypothetical protein
VKCVHGAEEELATADARALLDSAIEDECILVTRNYADYTRLAAAYEHGGIAFPGILFLPPEETPVSDLAERIARWLDAAGPEVAPGRVTWLPDVSS